MNTEMKHATYTIDAHEIQVQGNDRNTGKNANGAERNVGHGKI